MGKFALAKNFKGTVFSIYLRFYFCIFNQKWNCVKKFVVALAYGIFIVATADGLFLMIRSKMM